MIRRVFPSPRDHLVLALPLLALCGCAMCQDCFDEYYGAYGGRRPRADMVHGRVGSVIDPAAEAEGSPEFGTETPAPIDSPMQPLPLDASGSSPAAEPIDAAEMPTDAAAEPTDAGETPTEAGEMPTDAAEMPTDAGEMPTEPAADDQGSDELDLSSPFDVEPPTSGGESSVDPAAT